jgi:hypothetical protein
MVLACFSPLCSTAKVKIKKAQLLGLCSVGCYVRREGVQNNHPSWANHLAQYNGESYNTFYGERDHIKH